MTRHAAQAVALAITIALVGCAQAEPSTPPITDSTSESAEVVEEQYHSIINPFSEDGWELECDRAEPQLTKPQETLFYQAIDKLTSTTYDPVAVIGERAASGTSSAYLCTTAPKSADEELSWCVVVVRKTSSEFASVSSVRELDPLHPQMVEPTDGMLISGWTAPLGSDTVEGTANKTSTMPKGADAAFWAAIKDSDYDLYPVALLAAQAHDGMNFVILCTGSGDGAQDMTFIAYVHQDKDGTANIASAGVLALTYYASGHTPA